MGYRIIYLPERKRRRVWPWVFGLLCFGIACLCLLPQGKAAIETAFVPGELETTRQAFYRFTQSLGEGAHFPEALVQFCREVAAGIG